MIENAGDWKASVVDSFVEIKPSKLEASIKVEALIKVEPSVKVEASVKVDASNVNSGVWKLRDNEVDTSHFFSSWDMER